MKRGQKEYANSSPLSAVNVLWNGQALPIILHKVLGESIRAS
jgi:hypothetical protein